jgi:hypothetical protein
LANTKYDILVGNYGSGKTEIALNFALDGAAQGKKTVLVDLDIVNPYFRSSAKRLLLEEAGIMVIASEFANTGIDLPLVSAETARIFTGEFDYAVIDVGGDPVGATALGRYKIELGKIADRLNTNFVLNASRPQTIDLPAVRKMLELIEARGRVKMNWLINNTNLANESSPENLLTGQRLVEEVSRELDIPVRYITGRADILEKFRELTGAEFKGELRPIVMRMRPGWQDY